MSLSCTCPDDDGDFAWYYSSPEDFTKLETKKRKRCSSCKELINIGDTILKFVKWRYPKDDIEERIYGDGGEISMAPVFMCEKCGDQYMNLEALGFCINIEENMFELLKEYQEEYVNPKGMA